MDLNFIWTKLHGNWVNISRELKCERCYQKCFTHSFIHSLIHSLIHWFSDSLIQWFIDSFFRSFVHSFVCSFIHFPNQLEIYPETYWNRLWDLKFSHSVLPGSQRWSDDEDFYHQVQIQHLPWLPMHSWLERLFCPLHGQEFLRHVFLCGQWYVMHNIHLVENHLSLESVHTTTKYSGKYYVSTELRNGIDGTWGWRGGGVVTWRNWKYL